MKGAPGYPNHWSERQRLGALYIAADVLRANQPCHKVDCQCFLAPNTLMMTAEWRWPGVVRVSLKYTGVVIAQSLPGQPYVLGPPDPINEGGAP